jgi:hypothetical protein
MPTKLPDVVKSLVIEQWLEGISRDDIAATNGLSAGAVTNIVNEWRRGLGLHLADDLRNLSSTLKRVGISPAQCALGFRAAMAMINLGVKGDDFESFILEVYNRSKELGLTSDDIASHMKDLVGFSKTLPVSLSEIPNYIKQKTVEKEKMEEEMEALEKQISTLVQEKSDAQVSIAAATQDKEITLEELKWYSDFKGEMEKYGIPVNDVSYLSAIVNGIRHYGYDVDKVLEQFRDLNSLTMQLKVLQESVLALETKINILKQQHTFLEFSVNSHGQSISAYKELEIMGFGLKELRRLYHTVSEIADANSVDPMHAISKFFKDVEEQYDNLLGFEPKVALLRTEVNQLNLQRNRLRSEILSLPFVGSTLIKLIQNGVKDKDIIQIAELFENYRNCTGTGTTSDDTLGTNDTNIQTLISEVGKYSGIRSAIQSLKQEADRLSINVSALKSKKEALEMRSRKMSSALVYLTRVIDFMQGRVTSLRNEIVGLTSIVALVTMQLQNKLKSEAEEQIRKLKDVNEFIPLIRAYKGEAISVQELKK